MKKILIAAAALAGLTFAETPSVATPRPIDTLGLRARIDSLRSVDSALRASHIAKLDSVVKYRKAKDSAIVAKLPDSIKIRIDSVRTAWKAAALADSGVRKARFDSLKAVYTAKRDSAISKIKDTAVQKKVRARLAELDADKAAIKEKIDARKAEIAKKIEEIKARKDAPAVPVRK